MDVTIEQQGSTSVVRPAGRLDFGAAAGFQTKVDEALAGAGTKPAAVIIDASGLDFVSSAGLRVFLVGARNAKNAGIGLSVCNLQPTVREVFEVSGFDRIITIAGTLDEAIAAVGSRD